MRRVSRRLVVLPVLAASVLGISAVGATAKTSPAPTKHKVVFVTGGSTTITASKATVTFLTSHGVIPSAVAPATLSGPSLTLPVKGGVAVKKNLDGILFHRGAVKFSTTKRSVTVRRITLFKVGKKAHLAARVAGKVVVLASVSDLKASVTGKTATVTGELHLSAAVAHVINKLVGKHIVSAGFDFGSFTSSLTLR